MTQVSGIKNHILTLQNIWSFFFFFKNLPYKLVGFLSWIRVIYYTINKRIPMFHFQFLAY